MVAPLAVIFVEFLKMVKIPNYLIATIIIIKKCKIISYYYYSA